MWVQPRLAAASCVPSTRDVYLTPPGPGSRCSVRSHGRGFSAGLRSCPETTGPELNEETGNDEIRGFFAALRMTIHKSSVKSSVSGQVLTRTGVALRRSSDGWFPPIAHGSPVWNDGCGEKSVVSLEVGRMVVDMARRPWKSERKQSAKKNGRKQSSATTPAPLPARSAKDALSAEGVR